MGLRTRVIGARTPIMTRNKQQVEVLLHTRRPLSEPEHENSDTCNSNPLLALTIHSLNLFRPATPQNHCSRERERNGSKHIVREAAVVVHVGGIGRSLCTAAVALMWGQAAAAPVTLRCC